jgi:hypothetical protein
MRLKDEIVEYLREHPELAPQWAVATAVQISSVHTAKLTQEQVLEALNAALSAFAEERKVNQPKGRRKPKKTSRKNQGRARGKRA